MATMSAAAFAEKWAKRTKGAVSEYKDGVMNVSENPATKAAESVGKWQQAMSEQRTADRFTSGLGGVTLSAWKEAAANKGSQRIASGVDGAGSKMKAFGDYVVNTEIAIAKDVNAMPNATYEERKSKAIAMMDALHDNPYKG